MPAISMSARSALKRLKLDYVWWLVVAGQSAQDRRRMAPLTARLDRRAPDRGAPSAHSSSPALEAALGTRLHDRHGDGVAAALSAGRIRLADGQRQSGTIQPLAPLAGRSRAAFPSRWCSGRAPCWRRCNAPLVRRFGMRRDARSAPRRPLSRSWTARAIHESATAAAGAGAWCRAEAVLNLVS